MHDGAACQRLAFGVKVRLGFSVQGAVMAERDYALADKVVMAFRQILSDAARAEISEAQFQDLTLMIREALGDQLAESAEHLAELAKRLESRARTLKPDLDL